MDPARAERIDQRQAALLVELLAGMQAAVAGGSPLDSQLSRFYHQHPELGSRDRRLLSGTLFSYFRWKGWIDRIASTPAAACVLAHLLDSAEIHSAVLKLATKAGLPGSALVPMGPLSLADKAAALGRIAGTQPTPAELVPAWTLPMLPPGPAPLLEAFQTPPPTWLRVVPEQREAVLAALRGQGSEPLPHPRIPTAVSVRRGINLRALPRPIRHGLDIQDLSSQATGIICDPRPGTAWWDACCGSGGKTLHLAALGGPSVSILATDVRATILDELSRRVNEAGAKSVATALWDGASQPPPAGPFDGILLDAPCSGTGTWHRNPDARWRTTEETVTRLIRLQAQLLRTCATSLKPGGTLVYATCSVTRSENEDIVTAFLCESPDYQLAPFTNPLDGTSCAGCLRIDPWTGPCNGMFIAKLTRRANRR